MRFWPQLKYNMNGFIYIERALQQSWDELSRPRLFSGWEGTRQESFACGDVLVAWGQGTGDVHYSRNGEESIVVLCGYVSEVNHGPTLRGGEHAANFIHECLGRDSSTMALKALLDRLHGSFSLMYRDVRGGSFLCVSDRIASRPLWKMRGEHEWMVSSHPVAIAAAAPSVRVDLGALGAYLLYGGPVEPRKSLFTGIEAVPPGSIWGLRATGGVTESAWYKFQHQPDHGRSLTDWVDLASERLVRCASRIAAQCERPAVFLSGGVDSRLTAAALKAAGAKPLVVTLGDAKNLEVRVSEQVAAAMGLEQVIILRDKHWYLRGLPRVVAETGGSFLWTHGHFSQAVQKLGKEFGVQAFLLGDFCEAFSKLLCYVDPKRRSLWTPEEFVREFDQTRLPLYRPRNRNRTLSLLKSEIQAEVKEALAQDVLASWHNVTATSTDGWIVADQCFRWRSAATAPTFFMFQDLRSVAAERNLMFDKDVQSLLETLPSHLRNGANFGARLISKLDPAAGRALNSNSLLPLCWPAGAHKLSKQCRPVFGKVRRLVFGDTHQTMGAWPEKAALYGADPVWRDYVERVIEGNPLVGEEFFDRARVQECWQALRNGDRDAAEDIEKLLQLGILAECVQGQAQNVPVEANIDGHRA